MIEIQKLNRRVVSQRYLGSSIMTLPKVNEKNQFNQLGRYFLSARVDKGYSMEFVVEHAQIESVTTLAQFEAEITSIPLDRIYALANVLQISPRVILEWIEKVSTT